MTAVLVIAVIVGVIFVHGFGSTYNVETVLRTAAFLGFVAVGMTFIVATGNFIDLSVVAQLATAGVVTTVIEPHGLLLAILVGFASCLPFAAVNWFGAGLMRANCVVVTLGIETAGLGLLQALTGGNAYNGTSNSLHNLMVADVGPVPVPFVILVGLVLVAQGVLGRTRLGYRLRAVGANRAAASLTGINGDATLVVAFVTVSLCAAAGGIAIAGFDNGALSSMGTGFDFNSLAAVVVGGNTLTGGEASVLRTLIGVLFVEVVIDLLVLAGLPYTWQQITLGGLVILAVAVDSWMRRRESTA